MTLVNTDGSALFGPGSEWFWSMAQFVVVAVTLVGIYVQLRIARNANAFEQLNRLASDHDSEHMARCRLEILLARQEGVNAERVPEGAATTIMTFWENAAALVRAGHVDLTLIYESLGSVNCRGWWAELAPSILRDRIEVGNARIGAHFEWLAGVMAEMDVKNGARYEMDETLLAATRDRRLQNARDRIRLAEEMRAVVVRPMTLGATDARGMTPPRKRR
jgi:hypothetical protein